MGPDCNQSTPRPDSRSISKKAEITAVHRSACGCRTQGTVNRDMDQMRSCNTPDHGGHRDQPGTSRLRTSADAVSGEASGDSRLCSIDRAVPLRTAAMRFLCSETLRWRSGCSAGRMGSGPSIAFRSARNELVDGVPDSFIICRPSGPCRSSVRNDGDCSVFPDNGPVVRQSINCDIVKRGCSSVVEHHVANVDVEGSSPFARSCLIAGGHRRSTNPAFCLLPVETGPGAPGFEGP